MLGEKSSNFFIDQFVVTGIMSYCLHLCHMSTFFYSKFFIYRDQSSSILNTAVFFYYEALCFASRRKKIHGYMRSGAISVTVVDFIVPNSIFYAINIIQSCSSRIFLSAFGREFLHPYICNLYNFILSKVGFSRILKLGQNVPLKFLLLLQMLFFICHLIS